MSPAAEGAALQPAVQLEGPAAPRAAGREAGRTAEEGARKRLKLCSFHMARDGSCRWGGGCCFAHTEQELVPDPLNAVRWSGGVGVAELTRRQFGILDDDFLNVVCNRNSPLGNPFVLDCPEYEKIGPARQCAECYAEGDDGSECNCMVRANHDVLCDAFEEFWKLLLRTADIEVDLPARELAESVAMRRDGMLISHRWAWHAFSRGKILRAAHVLQCLVQGGKVGLVLLCHCGVDKPCHATLLQRSIAGAPLSQQAEGAQGIFQSAGEVVAPQRVCSHCKRHWLRRGAVDASRNRFYCAICWKDFNAMTYYRERESPLPEASLLQKMDP